MNPAGDSAVQPEGGATAFGRRKGRPIQLRRMHDCPLAVGRTMRSRGIRNIWKREGSTDLQKLHLAIAHHHRHVADPLSE
jgi:hypothetical protein